MPRDPESMTEPDASSGAASPADEAAVDWFLRLQEIGPDHPLRAQFQTWRDAAPSHAEAYARVEAIWRAPAFVESLEQPGRRPRRRISGTMMRMAASLLLCALVGAGAMQLAGITPRLPADHATRVGEQWAERLEDGTRLVLDSGSAIDLAYSPDERRVDVRSGRAFFDVGSDSRPFRVVADGITIRDIGTRFSVERDGHAVRVTVWDGLVAVKPDGQHASEQMLRAGQSGGHDGAFLPVRNIPSDISFAWLDHRLFFEKATLGQVVAQLRRYHRGWIVIGDDRLAAMQVSGGYDTRDVPAALDDLARLSHARLTRLSDRLLILH